jgi:thiaminase (transcriptional activator TenA)
VANAIGAPTSVHLREQNLDEWARALQHPLITRTADGTVDDAVFEHWVVMNTQFLRMYRRFFIVMGTLAPDTRSSTVMVQGLQSTDLEIEDAEQYGEERGLDMSVEPSARAMDYSSFVMATAAQGWARGLIASYGIEGIYYDAWLSVREKVTPDHRYWRFIDLWSNEYQRRFVRDISVLVDGLSLTTELERIFRSVARLERDSWDEACGSDAP